MSKLGLVETQLDGKVSCMCAKLLEMQLLEPILWNHIIALVFSHGWPITHTWLEKLTMCVLVCTSVGTAGRELTGDSALSSSALVLSSRVTIIPSRTCSWVRRSTTACLWRDFRATWRERIGFQTEINYSLIQDCHLLPPNLKGLVWFIFPSKKSKNK